MTLSSSSIFTVNISETEFTIREIPKGGVKIRPKINYKLSQKDKNTIFLSEGYGR